MLLLLFIIWQDSVDKICALTIKDSYLLLFCLGLSIANCKWGKFDMKGGFVGFDYEYTRYLSSCLLVGGTHSPRSHRYLYPSSFKLLLCWLRSLTPATELSMLLGMRSLAAALQLEIYWV